MTVIEGTGTPESHWLPWLDTAGWREAVPPRPPSGRRPRATVLAAHPDDEVLGAGGLLRLLSRAGWLVDVVWASDGEASHPGSRAVSPADLARRRRQESWRARAELGLSGAATWLALPDSGLAPHEDRLLEAVHGLLGRTPTDLLLAPWSGDGHPDHEVCGRVARVLGRRHRVPVWELPIWAWHWGDRDRLAPGWSHARLVALDEDARQAKADAVEAFVSQVRPVGTEPADAPVLPAHVLARFARPVEVVLCTGGSVRS